MLLRTASDTGAVLSFRVLFPSEIFLFWQVVAFQNIEIVLDVIQGCELRFQSFERGIFPSTEESPDNQHIFSSDPSVRPG